MSIVKEAVIPASKFTKKLASCFITVVKTKNFVTEEVARLNGMRKWSSF